MPPWIHPTCAARRCHAATPGGSLSHNLPLSALRGQGVPQSLSQSCHNPTHLTHSPDGPQANRPLRAGGGRGASAAGFRGSSPPGLVSSGGRQSVDAGNNHRVTPACAVAGLGARRRRRSGAEIEIDPEQLMKDLGAGAHRGDTRHKRRGSQAGAPCPLDSQPWTTRLHGIAAYN